MSPDGHLLDADLVLAVRGLRRDDLGRGPRVPRWVAALGGGFGLDDGEDEIEEETEEEVPEGEGEGVLFEGLDLDLRAGEGIGIVGGHEHAKEALFRILAGWALPTEGHVHVRGRVAPVSWELPKLFAGNVGRKGVRTMARLLGWSPDVLDQRFEEALRFAALGELATVRPRDAASWQLRRLALSAILHSGASVFVVDSVVAGRDESFGLRLKELLRQRKLEGAGIVMVGNEVGEFEGVCERVVVFERGRRPSIVDSGFCGVPDGAQREFDGREGEVVG